MKLYRILIMAGMALSSLSSCKKESPLLLLGEDKGLQRAELRVSLTNRRPELGDTVGLTASTWHKSDQINKVEFLHVLYEKFGVHLEVGTTSIETWSATDPAMVITDTIANNVAFKTVPREELNNFYVTQTNNYVINSEYGLFVASEGRYKMSGDELLQALPAEAYEILKNQLAYAIKVVDYETLFPGSPNTHFTMSGATKTGISAVGRAHLRANLTKDLLKLNYRAIRKTGALYATLNVKVTADSGAVTVVSNSLEQKNYEDHETNMFK